MDSRKLFNKNEKAGPSWNSFSQFLENSIKSIYKIDESSNLQKLWDFF